MANARRPVFFSSCFADSDGQRFSLRDRVATRFNLGPEKMVWLGEDFRELDPDSGLPALEKALFCVKGVRECDVYVAVIIDKHGSGVPLPGGRTTQASFFELELYAAALMKKPAYVFVLKDSDPHDGIAAVLDLLEPALPSVVRKPISSDEVLRQIERILAAARRPFLHPFRGRAASAQIAVNRTTTRWHRSYDPRKELPRARFLGGFVDGNLKVPDPAFVDQILTTVDRYSDHEDRLAVLWMAIRELMAVNFGAGTDPSLLSLWQRALSGWSSSGAWYGLHGHSLMGCLGAITSRAAVAQLAGDEVPHGALASETYSIARRVSLAKLKGELFATALGHIDVAIERDETSGKLAIKGSILRQLGRSNDAILAYRRVLELRESEIAETGSIGEAKSELGFALVANARTRNEGLRLLEAGVTETIGRGGFHVRAQRKLARGYLQIGAFRDAYRALIAAHDDALRIGALDQLSRLEQLAARSDRLLPPNWRRST